MSQRALPPGPDLSTARMRAQILRAQKGHTKGVLSAFSRLFKDLDGPKKRPETHAEKFAAGGVLKAPPPTGEVLHPTELETFLNRSEFPLVRGTAAGYELTSGANILSR